MKTPIFFSLISTVSLVLSGCGHHVVYQQVVRAESSVSPTAYAAQSSGLISAPVMVNTSSSHVRGVVLQQQLPNGVVIPAGQVRAVITPQQQRTLMMVPISSLNRQGVVYQPVRAVPMVRIPVLAMPVQAVQQQTMIAYPQSGYQQQRVHPVIDGQLDHLKATSDFSDSNQGGEDTF